MAEPNNCPRCGSDEISHGYSFPPRRGNVECHADGCGVLTVADDEDKAIELWNGGRWTHAIVDHDEMGIPIYAQRKEG